MGQPRQTFRVRAGEANGRNHKTGRLVRESRETPRHRRAPVQLIRGLGQERLGALLALLLAAQALGGRVGRWHRLGRSRHGPTCREDQGHGGGQCEAP